MSNGINVIRDILNASLRLMQETIHIKMIPININIDDNHALYINYDDKNVPNNKFVTIIIRPNITETVFIS